MHCSWARLSVSWPLQVPCTSLAESTGIAPSLGQALRSFSRHLYRRRGRSMHVAIIMDGNGRWATRRGLPRVAGHRAGVATVRRVVEHAPDLGVGKLTLYAFSCDNWRRPADEVESIFWLLRAYLRLETEKLRQRGARLEVIGRRDRLPKLLLREIAQAEHATAQGRGLHLRIA